MLLVAESIYDGTWSSGAPPDELVDFELCYALKWSYPDLAKTPEYVRRVFWDLLQARRKAEQDRQERRETHRRGH